MTSRFHYGFGVGFDGCTPAAWRVLCRALSSRDRVHNGKSSYCGNVTDDVMDFEVHLRQRLVDVGHVLTGRRATSSLRCRNMAATAQMSCPGLIQLQQSHRVQVPPLALVPVGVPSRYALHAKTGDRPQPDLPPSSAVSFASPHLKARLREYSSKSCTSVLGNCRSLLVLEFMFWRFWLCFFAHLQRFCYFSEPLPR